MFARSPLTRRRHPSRKAAWRAARFSPAPTQAAALLAFQTPEELPVSYPYEDPYDPDESVDALLEEVDALLGMESEFTDEMDEDEDDLGFQLFPKMRERAEERREARQEKQEKRETERSERQERETKDRSESRGQREKEVRLREQRAAERYEAEKLDRKAAAATRRRDQELSEMRFNIEKAKLATALAELQAAKSKSASTAAKVSGFGDAEVREARREARKQKQRTRAAKKAMKAAQARNTKKEKRKERVEAKGSKAMQSIFDPAHNLREASKQMLLLEDHLFQPPRQCPDCIRKHLLTAEALAEEAVTLDKELEWQMWTSVLPAQYRQWLVALEEDGSPTRKTQIANQVRQVRKNLVTALGSSNKIGVAEESGSQAAAPVRRAVRRRRKLRRMTGKMGALTSVEVKDSLGNTWRVHADGRIEALDGPLEGETTKPSDVDHAALVADLSANDDRVEKVLGTQATQKAAAGVNPYISGLRGGDALVFADRSGTGDEAKTTIKGWLPGEAVKIGTEVSGHAVESIPQDGWIAVWSTVGDKWYGQWVKADEVVRLADGKKASAILRGKTFNLYTADRGVRGGRLNDRQLAMADLIQAVMQTRLGDPYAKFTAASVDAPQALRLSVLSKIIAAAIVNAGYESWFDPMNKTGDGGKSVGLFQLHSGGGGRGMTVAQRQNPIVNTETITNELITAMNTPPGQSSEIRGEVYKLMMDAATGKNPSVGDWTFAFAVDVERPSDRVGNGNRRGKTAEELFPSRRPAARAVLAPAVVRGPSPQVVSTTTAPTDPPWKNPWVLGASAVAVLMTGAWAFSGSPKR